MICVHVIVQNKVEEAESKSKQIQEQLEGITQQVQELQPECAQLKVEAQRQNTLLKSSEVRVQIMHTVHWYSRFHKSTKSFKQHLNHCIDYSFLVIRVMTVV